MDEATLRDLSTRYLLPFFSGARIEDDALPSSARHNRVSFRNPCSIAFKINEDDNFRLVLTRPQPFVRTQEDKVPETRVIKSFVDTVRDMQTLIDSDYKEDVLTSLQRRVVAKSILRGVREDSFLRVIAVLTKSASSLYEGSAISSSIGLRNTPQTLDLISLENFSREDLGSVLSNGFDTIATFDYSGNLIQIEELTGSPNSPIFCPFRQSAIAEWTTTHQLRVAFTLNRLGEILVFIDRRLVFAYRSGSWHFLTHSSVLNQMNVPHDMALRKSIYATCLDASFSRTGACIGVAQYKHANDWKGVVSKNDVLASSKTEKASALRRTINGKRFQDLDRRLRQELVAIDGATIISYSGEILTVGAILKIPAGSTGGGRLAAARTVSELGLGIKVSQDGGITGFRPSGLAFTVMSN